jgi:methylmalonyl-CoA mutase N-terminal domain/subunit
MGEADWGDRPRTASELSIRMSRTRTLGGLETKPVFGPGDRRADWDYQRDLGDPGVYPYTRGSYPEMYRARMWTLRNIVGYGVPEDTREGVERALEVGSGGIDIIVDTVSQEAIDPDHPTMRADVGAEGCSLACVQHLETLLAGVDVTKTDIAWHVSVLLYPMLAAYLRRLNKPLSDLQGSHMPDYLGLHPMGYGDRLMPARLGHRATLECLEYVSVHSPRWACGFPQAYNLRQRGLSAAGEIGVGMAIARRTFRDLITRGVDIDTVAPAVAWVSPAGIDLFEEVAKFRALRRMWARMMRQEFGAQNPRSLRLRIACHTDGRALTYQQPLNNLARATVQTLAAILGGVQSVETCTYDEAISIPTPEARELAIRTQQILIHEAGAARTADPLGGSWYVESLTDDVERAAQTLLAEIEDRGVVEAIESGWIDSLMDEHNVVHVREMDTGERVVVGVNAFEPAEREVPARFEFDPARIAQHLERFRTMKEQRDPQRLNATLRTLYDVTVSGQNTYNAMIDAFDADATIGEVWGVFREGNGYPYDPFGVLTSPLAAAATGSRA